jgi:hypothetical protein
VLPRQPRYPLKEKKCLAPISFQKGMRPHPVNSHGAAAQYPMPKESYVGSRTTNGVSLVVLRKFGSRHQPLGYFRLNDKPVKNIRGLLLAEQNERRLYKRREFKNVHQQSIVFKLLSIEDRHKFHAKDVEVYRGLKPSCRRWCLQNALNYCKAKSVDCGDRRDYAIVHKFSGLQCASQKCPCYHVHPKDLAIRELVGMSTRLIVCRSFTLG